MGLIKVVSPAQAGRFINGKLSKIEQRGLTGGAALARLVRPGNIAAGFGIRGFDRTTEVVATAVSRSTEIAIPEMIALSDKLSIMKGELPVSLFKQVMAGDEITGHNADELQAILADPSNAGNALTYVSLNDAREFADRLSDLTCRKFRVQTEAEWLQAKDQLSGSNWTWTETETKKDSGIFVLRRLYNDDRGSYRPVHRSGLSAVRLVEDL